MRKIFRAINMNGLVAKVENDKDVFFSDDG